jgi:2-dehydropantoate 2-reductase
MKILVAGAGAVGTTLGSALVLGGDDVILVARGAHGQAMVENGLRFTLGDASHDLRPRVEVSISAAAEHGPFDLVLVSVKGYDTIPLASELALVLAPQQDILSMQNGVGNEAALSAALPRARILAGTLTSACWLASPGRAVAQAHGGAMIEMPKERSESVTALVASLQRGGLQAQTHGSGAEIKWSKLLLNMLGSATTAILGWTPTQVFNHRKLFGLELEAFREAHATMRAMALHPIQLPDYPVPSFVALAARLPAPLLFPIMRGRLSKGRGDRLPGPAADLAAGRKHTEADFMAGAVQRAGHGHSVTTPVNRCFADLVSGIAEGRIDPASFHDQPEALLMAVANSVQAQPECP